MFCESAIDVGKYRYCACIDDAGDRRKKSPRRNDDFIACADAERLERQVERHRAIGQRDGMSRPGEGRELGLETCDLLRQSSS